MPRNSNNGTPQKRKEQFVFLLPVDYARAAGISRQRVYQLIAAKRFETKLIGRRIHIRDKRKRKVNPA
jgi:hypothetical protein